MAVADRALRTRAGLRRDPTVTSSVHRDWLTRHPTLPLITVLGPARERQAVMACAIGLDLAEIAPFVRSLRAVFAGQVILLVDRKPTLLAWLSTHGVEAVIAADRLLHWKPHSAVGRFAVFAQLLQERREISDVLLAETRGAVFQADPFRHATGDLEFFTGAGGTQPSLGEQRAVAAMIGESLAHDLRRRGRIADLVAGPTEAVIRFCRSLLLVCARPRVGFGAGLDRAACHVVAHLGLAGGEIRRNFRRAAIASCGMRIAEGRILNPDDSSSPIVVGYRSSSDLALHVDRLWGVAPQPSTGLRLAMRSIQMSLLGGASAFR